MSRRVIDIHQHLHANTVTSPEPLVEAYARLGVEKAVLLGLPPVRRPGNNVAVLQAAKDYPDLFIPFAGVDLDRMGPDDVQAFRDQGFHGLKVIAPGHTYDHSGYFPLYEKACQLGMPCLFHLGLLANRAPWCDANSNNMKPIYLDFIARQLPELTLIGAHLGNPWYDEASMSCRWNPNLFFDLSGSTLKKKSPRHIGDLLWWRPESTPYRSPEGNSAWDKICFGSDLAPEHIEDSMHDYQNLMDTLEFSEEEQHKVWYANAARILGID
jgi:uncharacterized protein